MHNDLLTILKHNPGISSADMLPYLYELGYYRNIPDNTATQDISKKLAYLKKQGKVIAETVSGRYGKTNIWSLPSAVPKQAIEPLAKPLLDAAGYTVATDKPVVILPDPVNTSEPPLEDLLEAMSGYDGISFLAGVLYAKEFYRP